MVNRHTNVALEFGNNGAFLDNIWLPPDIQPICQTWLDLQSWDSVNYPNYVDQNGDLLPRTTNVLSLREISPNDDIDMMTTNVSDHNLIFVDIDMEDTPPREEQIRDVRDTVGWVPRTLPAKDHDKLQAHNMTNAGGGGAVSPNGGGGAVIPNGGSSSGFHTPPKTGTWTTAKSNYSFYRQIEKRREAFWYRGREKVCRR